MSVAVSIVKSRQVSEAKKQKFIRATSVPGGGKGETCRRNRSAIPLFSWPCQREIRALNGHYQVMQETGGLLLLIRLHPCRKDLHFGKRWRLHRGGKRWVVCHKVRKKENTGFCLSSKLTDFRWERRAPLSSEISQKQTPPLRPPQGLRHSPTVGS